MLYRCDCSTTKEQFSGISATWGSNCKISEPLYRSCKSPMNTDDRLGITETIPVVGGMRAKSRVSALGSRRFPPMHSECVSVRSSTPNPILNGKISIFRGFTKGYDPRLGRRKTRSFLSIFPGVSFMEAPSSGFQRTGLVTGPATAKLHSTSLSREVLDSCRIPRCPPS